MLTTDSMLSTICPAKYSIVFAIINKGKQKNNITEMLIYFFKAKQKNNITAVVIYSFKATKHALIIDFPKKSQG